MIFYYDGFVLCDVYLRYIIAGHERNYLMLLYNEKRRTVCGITSVDVIVEK